MFGGVDGMFFRVSLPSRWGTLLSRWMSRQRWYLGKEDKPPIVVVGVEAWLVEVAG